MIVALVVAVADDRVIGRDGALPWSLPADLRYFRALTTGHHVVMGRKTHASIGRALPGRTNLVLTRADTAPFEGQRVVHSLDQAIAIARETGELAVVGGGEVYALALPRATHLYLTWVDTNTPDADAHFPRFDPVDWIETACEHHPADAKHAVAMDFVDYLRA